MLSPWENGFFDDFYFSNCNKKSGIFWYDLYRIATLKSEEQIIEGRSLLYLIYKPFSWSRLSGISWGLVRDGNRIYLQIDWSDFPIAS